MSAALTSIRNRCDWTNGLPNILDQRRESLKEKNLPNILDPSLQHNAWMLNRMAIDQARIPEEGKKTPTVFRAVSYIQAWLNSVIFFNYGWVWTLICILGAGYAIFRYLFRQDRRIDVLLLLTLSLSWMAYTLISTAFVYPLERLSYPLEWMRYLCAILTIRFSLPSFHLSHFKAFP
ncbi:MAG: hypothetical protein IH599_00015 [Bacteroidales bacterium]|nr:hypothetical protein [Bacteroidales bacterium]